MIILHVIFPNTGYSSLDTGGGGGG